MFTQGNNRRNQPYGNDGPAYLQPAPKLKPFPKRPNPANTYSYHLTLPSQQDILPSRRNRNQEFHQRTSTTALYDFDSHDAMIQALYDSPFLSSEERHIEFQIALEVIDGTGAASEPEQWGEDTNGSYTITKRRDRTSEYSSADASGWVGMGHYDPRGSKEEREREMKTRISSSYSTNISNARRYGEARDMSRRQQSTGNAHHRRGSARAQAWDHQATAESSSSTNPSLFSRAASSLLFKKTRDNKSSEPFEDSPSPQGKTSPSANQKEIDARRYYADKEKREKEDKKIAEREKKREKKKLLRVYGFLLKELEIDAKMAEPGTKRDDILEKMVEVRRRIALIRRRD